MIAKRILAPVSYRTRNIAIAVALAAAAAVLVTVYVSNTGSSSSTALGKDVSLVVVARQDIPVGTPGSELGGKISVEQVPRSLVVPGAITNQSQVQAKVTTQEIYKGEQVTVQRFQPLESQGLRGQIAGNQRAIEVPGDANQLLVGTLKVGDRIDVLANLKYQPASLRGVNPNTSAAQTTLTATRIVLRNIRVLREPQQPPGSSRFSAGATYSVILALTDNQAQKLFFVLKNGDWSFQLRPSQRAADSPESVETPGSILSDGLRPPQLAQLIPGGGGGRP